MGGFEYCLRNGYRCLTYIWASIAAVNPAALLLQHVGWYAAYAGDLGTGSESAGVER